MSNKYLSAGTASWTQTTRTIAGATLNTPFVADDATYQRQVMFRIGTSLYYGRVSTYASGTSVTLLNGGSLPSGDGTIAELFLFDLSEAHSYQDYLNKIASMIKDNASALSTSDKDRMIAQAVSDYNRDMPFYVKKKIAGNGTADYVLSTIFGSLWKEGFSQIRSIEYPFGEKPAAMLNDDEWEIYDDGTAQDGSNKVLRFIDDTPSVSEYFVVGILTEMDLPTSGTQNFPDTDENFTNITLLASAYCCYILAANYAQSSDSTISADVVNYHDKTRKYTELGRVYQKRYNQNVFGAEDASVQIHPAMADKDLDLDGMAGDSFVFHGGRNR